MREHLWARARFCSISCSKKKENAMWVPGAKEKMQATLREIGHRPVERAGNGRGLTAPQIAVLNWLGDGWVSEHPVPTGVPRQKGGLPTCYKIDVANPTMMIAIELDGPSHAGKRMKQDRAKDNHLVSLGWKVYRLKNSRAIQMCSTSMCQDTLLTMLEEFSYITAI